MKVQIAFDPEVTRNLTWQAPFKPVVKCVHCGEEARLAFVAHEGLQGDKEEEFVAGLYENHAEDKLWLHDACAVAVYFCTGCLKPTADYNQA
jgi:hypothetical protein